MFQAAGVPQRQAEYASETFIRASLRHTGHHDISYLPHRLRLLKDGTINPKGEMKEIFRSPGFIRFDGQGALGEYCCAYLLNQTIELAKTQGIAMGSVAHSNHFLAGHPYGQMAAERGCMALVWSNTDPCMGDPQSQAEVIGNNPLGFGAPGDQHPWVLDLCMAYSSLGKLGEYQRAEKPIPENWGRNSQGERTTKADEVLLGGICSPMAEHKGFGLALMHELLAGGLSQGEMGPQVQPRGGWQVHSQSILVIDLKTCGAQETWQQRMGELRSNMNKRLPNEIRLPGDHLYAEKESSRDKIILNSKTFQRLADFSENHGITIPASSS